MNDGQKAPDCGWKKSLLLSLLTCKNSMGNKVVSTPRIAQKCISKFFNRDINFKKRGPAYSLLQPPFIKVKKLLRD